MRPPPPGAVFLVSLAGHQTRLRLAPTVVELNVENFPGALTMQLKTIASFVVAIVLGLIAVILVRNWLVSAQSSVAAANTVPVVVVAETVKKETLLAPSMFKIVNYPQDAVPSGSFHSVDQFLASGGGHRTADRDLRVNEIVLAQNATGANENSVLSSTLTAGMRAVSVRSNEIAGVAGFIVPGDRVDILSTHPSASNSNGTVTEVLAQNIRVLGIDQSSNVDVNKPAISHAVTLEVSPQQAQAISLAQSVGSLTLSLRTPHDNAALDSKPMSAGGSAETKQRAPAPKVASMAPKSGAPFKSDTPTVRVVRGV